MRIIEHIAETHNAELSRWHAIRRPYHDQIVIGRFDDDGHWHPVETVTCDMPVAERRKARLAAIAAIRVAFRALAAVKCEDWPDDMQHGAWNFEPDCPHQWFSHMLSIVAAEVEAVTE